MSTRRAFPEASDDPGAVGFPDHSQQAWLFPSDGNGSVDGRVDGHFVLPGIEHLVKKQRTGDHGLPDQVLLPVCVLGVVLDSVVRYYPLHQQETNHNTD